MDNPPLTLVEQIAIDSINFARFNRYYPGSEDLNWSETLEEGILYVSMKLAQSLADFYGRIFQNCRGEYVQTRRRFEILPEPDFKTLVKKSRSQ